MLPRREVLRLAFGAGIAALVTGPAAAQGPHNPSRLLRVEFSVGPGRKGQPELSGYVYNDYGRSAGGVRLLVEHLDAAGQVTGTATVYVSGTVPAFGRAYFAASVPAGAGGHRVVVLSFDWETGAGS